LKIGVIGAGIGGLSVAIRLAIKGHDVTVFEANDYPGGKLTSFQQGPYRFDAGPSLFTMPHYIDELFLLAEENPKDHFLYSKLPIVCNYFWEDGTTFHANGDIPKFVTEAAQVFDENPKNIQKYFNKSAKKYNLTGKIFLESSLHKFKTWLGTNVFKAFFYLPKFEIFTSMHKANKAAFSNPKLVQLFNRYATYNGSNPYKASGILTIIPHFEFGFGAYFPSGGMESITKSLYELAKRNNVKFVFNTKIEEIVIENQKVKGLKSTENTFMFDTIVSNMDVYYTYKNLLKNNNKSNQILTQERSSSALIFYWGVQHIFENLDLHNIFFSNDYEKEFDAIDKGNVFEDPTIYINITSKLEAKDAPVDSENWFVMINVPYDQNQDWDALIRIAKQNILNKLNRILKIKLEELIENESILDPRSIQSKTMSYTGSLYGTSSNTLGAAFVRHPNFSNNIENLYFVGGSVHPGGGIPLCLLSAAIVSDLIKDVHNN
jgi:phytoene desaturase